MVFLGHYFLHNASTYLRQGQKLFVAGAYEGDIMETAWYVTSESNPEPEPELTNNAEETDNRVWLRVRKTGCERVLSPDTDVCT